LVEVDVLACLDYLIWLHTSEEVARHLNLNQSTISRNFHKCCKEFSLISSKVDNEYSISGDLTLLNLQRKVHQSHRWEGGRPWALNLFYFSLEKNHYLRSFVRQF
jgi:hypothetical protein